METEKISRWAFVAFILVAFIMGLIIGYMAFDKHPAGFSDPGVADVNGWVTLTMLILGIVVGVTSITAKKVIPFLTVTIALVVTNVADVWSPLSRVH